MDFKRVASYFDDMACLDAYTNALAFYGQLGLFDDNKRDSVTSERRVISTSASALIPGRRCVRANGRVYILGTPYPDNFLGGTVRVGYVAHEASPVPAHVGSLADLCNGTQGTDCYAARVWIKDKAFSEQSSVLVPQYDIHFASTEIVDVNDVVLLLGDMHIVRSVNNGPAGTKIALCELMSHSSMEVAKVSRGAYSAALGQFVVSSVDNLVNVIRVRWQALFSYQGAQAPAFEPGDVQLAMSALLPQPAPGTLVDLTDGRWMVKSAVRVGGVYLCRAAKSG